MRFLLFLLFAFSVNSLAAQSKDTIQLKEVDTSAFQRVEVEASVDARLWIDHLRSELMRPIDKAVRKGMKPGTYTVQVKFLIERDGSINDVQALNDPGYGLGKAAVKVVKTGPKWRPGEINGRKVRSYHTQPISFVIQAQ